MKTIAIKENTELKELKKYITLILEQYFKVTGNIEEIDADINIKLKLNKENIECYIEAKNKERKIIIIEYNEIKRIKNIANKIAKTIIKAFY